MEIEDLITTAELVAEFDGLHPGAAEDYRCPFRVYWHPHRQQWLIDVRFHKDVTSPEALRAFAESILVAARGSGDRPWFEDYTTLVDEDNFEVEAGVYVEGQQPVALHVAITYTPGPDDLVGVSERGGPLYTGPFWAPLVELSGSPANQSRLVGQARALLHALNAT